VPSSLFVSSSPTIRDLLYVGATYPGGPTTYYFDGEIGEVRISNIARSDAWLKASYYTIWDNFVTYSGAEYFVPGPAYYYQGYVREKGTGVSRSVKLYRRTTGEFVSGVTSSGNGYYYLTSPYNEDHFVVAFDDEAGDVYNALILDRLPPTGIA
jgi:hypothetical protein